MSLQARIQFAERSQFFHREKSEMRKCAVINGADMTIAQKEKILILSVHGKISGIVFHDSSVERNRIFHPAKRTARATRVYRMNHSYNISPNLLAKFFISHGIVHFQ